MMVSTIRVVPPPVPSRSVQTGVKCAAVLGLQLGSFGDDGLLGSMVEVGAIGAMGVAGWVWFLNLHEIGFGPFVTEI